MTFTNWALIAPIDSFHINIWKTINLQVEKEFDLGNGVKLAATPEYVRKSDDLYLRSAVGRWKSEQIAECPICLVKRFQDPIPQSSPGNYNYPWELLREADEAIRVANICLWIAKPSTLGFENILTANDAVDGYIVRSVREYPCLVPHDKDVNNRVDETDLNLAQKLNAAWARVPRDTPLGVAKAVVAKALLDNWETSRYLLFWVALEALFAPVEPREATRRFALRLSSFLESEPGLVRSRFKLVKDCYRWRSNIAHGRSSSGKPLEEMTEIYSQSEFLLRESLKRILMDRKLFEEINGENRDEFLDSIITETCRPDGDSQKSSSS